MKPKQKLIGMVGKENAERYIQMVKGALLQEENKKEEVTTESVPVSAK